MKKITLLIVVTLFAFNYLSYSQECKVLKSEIATEYSGECKKGLAHGFGKAIGKDIYEGDFRNGLPHGSGKYFWSTGEIYEGKFSKGLLHGKGEYKYIEEGTEVIKTGTWVRGEFRQVGGTGSEYKILTQRSIDAVRVVSIGMGTTVTVKIYRSGSPLKYSNLYVSGSSGQHRLQGEEIRFEHVVFPFTGSVRYSVTNKMRTGSFDCELEITILKSGSWEVVTSQ